MLQGKVHSMWTFVSYCCNLSPRPSGGCVYSEELTVHGDLIGLQFEDLLLEELLLDVTLQVMLPFGEPLETHLWSH